MELVGELPASHHLASSPVQEGGRVGWGGFSTDEAPPGLTAESSPPKHFSSHQSRHTGREVYSGSPPPPPPFLSSVTLFGRDTPLGYGALFTHSCWVNRVFQFINNF